MAGNKQNHPHIPSPQTEDEVFEVKLRKNRQGANHVESTKTKRNSNDVSSSFLNSLAHSASTLSLNKASIFPTVTSRKKDSISMSLSRRGGSDGEDNVKITGYLEKRSKMLGWKKHWFVLDGRLLTYYKSKEDYDSLSVCTGSINLGIASTVRPIKIRGCKGYPLQIVTRSQVYYLRSPDKQILEQWLLAIQEAASSQPAKISNPIWADPGAQFFRYSFASSSQWSLNTSTDDITDSLKKLPPNFFLKGSPPLANISHKLKKCHSFASLESPSSAMSNPFRNRIGDSSFKKKVSKEAEDCPRIPPVERETLKQELTRKLSVGKGGEDDATTVKPSLTQAKSKSDLHFLMKPHDGQPNHYDEIVDFETVYENYNDSTNSSARSSASSNIAAAPSQDKNRARDEDNNVISSADTGIYESVDSVDPDLCNSNGANHIGGDSPRTKRSSVRSSKSEERGNKVGSGYQYNWEENKSSSNPNTVTKASGANLSQQLLERKYSVESGSSNTSRENLSEGKRNKKYKGFGGFFQKMFKREGSKKGKDNKGNQNLIITGPIDLKGIHQDSPLNRPTNLSLDKALTRKLSTGSQGSTPIGQEHAEVMDELKTKVHGHGLHLTRVADHILSKVGQQDDDDHDVNDVTLSRENSSSKKATLPRPKVPRKPQTKNSDEASSSKSSSSPNAPQGRIPDEDKVMHRKKGLHHTDDFQEKLAKFNRLSAHLSSTFEAAMNPPSPLQYPTIGGLGRSRSFKFLKKKPFEEATPPLPPKKKSAECGPTSEKNCYDYPTNNKPVPPVKNFKLSPTKKKSKPVKRDKSSDKSDLPPKPPLKLKDDDGCDKGKKQVDLDRPSSLRALRKKNSAPDIIFSTCSRSSSDESERNSKDNIFEEIMSPSCPPVPPKSNNSTLTQSLLRCKSISPNKDGYDMVPAPEPVISQSEHQNDSKHFGKKADITAKEPQKIDSVRPLKKDCDDIGKHPTHISSSNENGNPKKTSPNTQSPAAKPTIGSNGFDTLDKLYQNLQYATVNTIVQEYETVEEVDDEVDEMYDDFPTDYSGSGGGSHTYESISPIPNSNNNSNNTNALRHSGIDALQMYLDLECKKSGPPPFPPPLQFNTSSDSSDTELYSDVYPGNLPPLRPVLGGGGAVNKLGHSSAVDQLKRMVNKTDV